MHIFLRMKFNNFLIWQVAAKVTAEPSCVQVRFSIRYFLVKCFSKNLMMLTQKSNKKKSFQNWFTWLAFYFHRQSDENRIMRTVKEIQSDFNWIINLVNIAMFTYSLIKSVSVILFISYLPHCSGVEIFFGQDQAQGFLNFFNPSPVSDLPSPNL